MTRDDESFEAHLERAATLAAERGMAADEFMNAALRAFVAQHPGILEQIEAMQMIGQLHALRLQGRVASA